MRIYHNREDSVGQLNELSNLWLRLEAALCFNAQQAAEKALKAVCLAYDLEFPKTHSLVYLTDIIEAGGVEIPIS